LPRRGSRVRSPSRALLDNKKDFQMGSPFLLSEKCEALLETQLLRSLGSISRDAKAPLGRAKAKVHWTLWHPARALVNKKDFRMRSPFLLSEKCEALLETQLLRSLDSISRSAKAPLGRASAKVHRTLWHPARALLFCKEVSIYLASFLLVLNFL
jgi:hypothetical protein